jgi:hypothetical protein
MIKFGACEFKSESVKWQNVVPIRIQSFIYHLAPLRVCGLIAIHFPTNRAETVRCSKTPTLMSSNLQQSSNISLAMSNIKGLPDALNRDKPRWRETQRKLPIGAKVALLGQIILETLELEKIKKHAKSL